MAKRLINNFDKQVKEIEENPFIPKKSSFLWRIAGGRMSQADYMIHACYLRTKVAILDVLLLKGSKK